MDLEDLSQPRREGQSPTMLEETPTRLPNPRTPEKGRSPKTNPQESGVVDTRKFAEKFWEEELCYAKGEGGRDKRYYSDSLVEVEEFEREGHKEGRETQESGKKKGGKGVSGMKNVCKSRSGKKPALHLPESLGMVTGLFSPEQWGKRDIGSGNILQRTREETPESDPPALELIRRKRVTVQDLIARSILCMCPTRPTRIRLPIRTLGKISL